MSAVTTSDSPATEALYLPTPSTLSIQNQSLVGALPSPPPTPLSLKSTLGQDLTPAYLPYHPYANRNPRFLFDQSQPADPAAQQGYGNRLPTGILGLPYFGHSMMDPHNLGINAQDQAAPNHQGFLPDMANTLPATMNASLPGTPEMMMHSMHPAAHMGYALHHQHPYHAQPAIVKSPKINVGEGRVYRCTKPNCSKIYKNSNGLKYHLEKGSCELDYNSQDELEANTTTSDSAAIKIAHRPYCCKVPGCGRKYKNLNGLKYHAKASHPELDFKSQVKLHRGTQKRPEQSPAQLSHLQHQHLQQQHMMMQQQQLQHQLLLQQQHQQQQHLQQQQAPHLQ